MNSTQSMTLVNHWDEAMTVKQVADYLKVSRSTVYRMVAEGVLGTVKTLGGKSVIPRRALDGYIEGLKTSACRVC